MIRVRLVAKTTLHIGHEVSATPSFLDSKTFRIRRADGTEALAIPGSSLKGATRSRFEEEVRRFVIGDLSWERAVKVAKAAYEILRQALIEVDDVLERYTQQRRGLAEKLDELLARERVLAIEGRSLGEPWEASPYSLLPLVCDPLSQLHCNPLTSVLEFGEDAEETVRLVASYVLLRRAPNGPHYCPACSIFGGNGYSSPTTFHHLEASTSVTGLQTRVSIDRLTGAARYAKLFTTDYVAPHTSFEGCVEVHDMPNWVPARDKVVDVVKTVLTRVKQLGKYRSVGYGIVDVEVVGEASVDDDAGCDEARPSTGAGVGNDAIREFLEEWLRSIEKAYCSHEAEKELEKLLEKSLFLRNEIRDEKRLRDAASDVAEVITRYAKKVLELVGRCQ